MDVLGVVTVGVFVCACVDMRFLYSCLRCPFDVAREFLRCLRKISVVRPVHVVK